ncbi:hypothetical protein os4_35600 (plasmid) [Comamonadaceae bacterium OS-4]|nr:hypothetical protein os4_35600 [Comamonadaceae bacterium OS-4]
MHITMNMDQLQAALEASPAQILQNGIQFHDGQRQVNIPAAYSYEIAAAVAMALREMVADQDLAESSTP